VLNSNLQPNLVTAEVIAYNTSGYLAILWCSERCKALKAMPEHWINSQTASWKRRNLSATPKKDTKKQRHIRCFFKTNSCGVRDLYTRDPKRNTGTTWDTDVVGWTYPYRILWNDSEPLRSSGGLCGLHITWKTGPVRLWSTTIRYTGSHAPQTGKFILVPWDSVRQPWDTAYSADP